MGLIDLHSHILPGVDDGSTNLAESLQMLRGLRRLGYTTVTATPHQKAGQFLPGLDEVRDAHAQVIDAADAAGIELHIPLGAENMWDEVFYERAETDAIPSYGSGPAFLVELPLHHMPPGVAERMFRFRVGGKLPVLAHPERYTELCEDRDATKALAGNCALLVDLPALAGHHGRACRKYARMLVSEGLAHAAASDAHTPGDVRKAADGIAWIRKKLGDAAIQRLLADAPSRILAGEHPAE